MFTYKTTSNKTLEIIVNHSFSEVEVNRAFLFMEALVENTTEVIFKVKPRLKNDLIGMLQSNQDFPIYSFTIQ
ncbi:MAG TPA: hypothetical protein ENH91_12050 [Leeuwenhoekiella sp.]|nr:hypothetical protein [Leeuwenhoekiella sp.]